MNEILNAKNKYFYDEVIPYIISGYPSLIKKYYDKMQNQKSISAALWSSYKPEEKQYVEIDYTNIQLQKVYLMKYFIPHAVLIPFVLDSLSRRNNGDLLHTASLELLRSNALNVSFFGGGPSPELFGLMHYLKKIQPNTIGISSAVLDKTKWQIAMKPDYFFETNLIAPSGSFLHPNAADVVRRSDLVVIQNCLNEIPGSGCNYNQQLLMNMKRIVNLLKPGSLMLVIERYGYELVRNLLNDFRVYLTTFNNLKIDYEAYKKLELKESYNNMNISNNMINDLRSDWLLMNNCIHFQWLAVSKSSYCN